MTTAAKAAKTKAAKARFWQARAAKIAAARAKNAKAGTSVRQQRAARKAARLAAEQRAARKAATTKTTTKPAKASPSTKTTTKTTKKVVAQPGPGQIRVRLSGRKDDTAIVDAKIVGEFFAVHRPCNGIPGARLDGYDLTHVPTGARIANYRKRATAWWAGEQLRALGGADVWQFTDPKEAPKRTAAITEQVRELATDTLAEPAMAKAAGQATAAKLATKTKAAQATDAPTDTAADTTATAAGAQQ